MRDIGFKGMRESIDMMVIFGVLLMSFFVVVYAFMIAQMIDVQKTLRKRRMI